MSLTFTKLFSSITESTIWTENDPTRIIWITMMAMADRRGRVWASIPGLANRARASVEDVEAALSKFLSPDKYSRTTEHEGRRIEQIEGGWRLLNHEKYRAIRDEEAINESKRKYINTRRAVENVERGRHNAEADSESDTEAENKSVSNVPIVPVVGESQAIPTSPAMKTKKNDAPYESIVALYHETLPELPKVVKLTKQRHGYIRQRWQEDLPDLQAWTDYFNIVRKSKFLMGKTSGSKGRPPFRADLTWLCRPENIVKVIEGKYHA